MQQFKIEYIDNAKGPVEPIKRIDVLVLQEVSQFEVQLFRLFRARISVVLL